jgi:hypothetical protein
MPSSRKLSCISQKELAQLFLKHLKIAKLSKFNIFLFKIKYTVDKLLCLFVISVFSFNLEDVNL